MEKLLVRKQIVNDKQKIIGYDLSNDFYGIELLKEDTLYKNKIFLHEDYIKFLPEIKEINNDNLYIVLNFKLDNIKTFLNNFKILKENKIKVCVKNFLIAKELQPIVKHVDFIFFNINNNIDVIKKDIRKLKYEMNYNNICIEGVNTYTELEIFKKEEISFFSGWYFLNPKITNNKNKKPSQNYATLMKLIEEISKGSEINEIEKILKKDPVISYKLLKLINSSSFGMEKEVLSFKHAITILGYNELYKWLVMLLMNTDVNDNNSLLTKTALIRGKFLESIAKNNKDNPESLFLLGVFTVLPIILEQDIDVLLNDIILDDEIKNALINKSGMYVKYINYINTIENDIKIIEDFDVNLFNKIHLNSIIWSENIN